MSLVAVRERNIVHKISDWLKDRQKTNNNGTCRRCQKVVYWSTSKIASHIRSGHCSGATEEEVQKFKNEFVYETPKNLVHKDKITRMLKREFKMEPMRPSLVKASSKSYLASHNESSSIEVQTSVKKAKMQASDHDYEEDLSSEQTNKDEDSGNEETDQLIHYEEEATDDHQNDDEMDERVEIVYIPPIADSNKHIKKDTIAQGSKEEKFISAVYPKYKGKTKLNLIEEIIDLSRRNELLEEKVRTYTRTINSLL